MSANGGLSKEEFLLLQEQLIALRNRNYELQEALQKRDHEVSQLSSPRSEALQFANKLINRRDKEKELVQKYESELDALRRKLISQEEEFRLQQKTLISELNKIVSHNESMSKELDRYKADDSIYSSPQAGTPCDSQPTIADFIEPGTPKSTAYTTDVAINTDTFTTTTCDTQTLEEMAASPELSKQAEFDRAEKEAIISALENKLLEYKGRIEELGNSTKELSSDNVRLSANIQEKEEKIMSLMEELNMSEINLAKKDGFLSYVLGCLSRIKEKLLLERICFPDQSTDVDVLDKELSVILESISSSHAAVARAAEEKTALQQHLQDVQTEVQTLLTKINQIEDTHRQEKISADEEIRALSTRLLNMKEAHDSEMQLMRKESEIICEELKAKVAALEDSDVERFEDRVLLLETRYQLELADREKTFETEREELLRKVRSLEASLLAKDEEKALSLKKQAALIKELQRAVKEEKKRAESLEKLGRCSSEERGWHLVGEADAKSAQTLDGADSRSVSSGSALESDNIDLINRLTTLQRLHADALDRMTFLENENLRLNKEIREKSELIEHWIRKRPLIQGSGIITPSKPEGALRKFLSSTLPADEATNDIREMNKKLQRMLEETLSKNIILQRDLQTLLERTEM